MSDFDDRARDVGERVRRDAERIAATIEPHGPSSTSGRQASTSITRPIVDPAVCEPISASNGAPSGLPRDPSSNLPLTLFARPSELPVSIQIIGDPVDGQAKPFALVQRYFDRARQLMSAEYTESINGIDVFVSALDNGNGEAELALADGSVGYLQSRGLDREQLIAILTQLTPRPADSPIPGFDYGAGGPDGLALIAERLNTNPRSGEGAGSQCRMASTGLVYRVCERDRPRSTPGRRCDRGLGDHHQRSRRPRCAERR